MDANHFFQLIKIHGVNETLHQMSVKTPEAELLKRRLENLSTDLKMQEELTEYIFVEKNRIAYSIMHFLVNKDAAEEQENMKKIKAVLNEYLEISDAAEAKMLAKRETFEERNKEQAKKMVESLKNQPVFDFSPIPVNSRLSLEEIVVLARENETVQALRHLNGHVQDTSFKVQVEVLIKKHEKFSRDEMLGLLDTATIIIEKNRIAFSIQELIGDIQQSQTKQSQTKSGSWWQRLFFF